jgi:hypothetical protein
MTTVIDNDDRVRNLEAFANPNAPSQLPTVAAPSVANIGGERIVGAQPVAVYRDEVRVLQKLTALGATVGSNWYYRFPVKKKGGGTDYIEGPSIKLANDLARIYGNCEIQTRVIDIGESWMIYARFNDFETGYALERPFQQYKGASKMGGEGKDADARRLDIALQIGVSKAIRNVVTNALQTFADEAMEAAKKSLVEKIGKDLVRYRDRTIQGIANQEIDLHRVERVINRPAKDWTAPDVAKIIAMMKAVADGMATVDETFPVAQEEKVDPKTGEVLDKFAKDDAKETAGAGGAEQREGHAAGHQPATQEASSAEETQQDESPSKAEPAAGDAEAGDAESPASAATTTTDSGAVPTNDVQYKLHAKTWIAEQTNGEECNARWAREKKLRKDCQITQETFDELEGLKKAKVIALKKKS